MQKGNPSMASCSAPWGMLCVVERELRLQLQLVRRDYQRYAQARRGNTAWGERRQLHQQLSLFSPLQRILRAYLEPNQNAESRARWVQRYAKAQAKLGAHLQHRLFCRMSDPGLPRFELFMLPAIQGDELVPGQTARQWWRSLVAQRDQHVLQTLDVRQAFLDSLRPEQQEMLRVLAELGAKLCRRTLIAAPRY